MKQTFHFMLVCLAMAVFAAPVFAQNRRGGNRQPQRKAGQTTSTFQTTVPAHPYDIMLARPERDSICLQITANSGLNGWITFGTDPKKLDQKTESKAVNPGGQFQFQLQNLKPDTKYWYTFQFFRILPGIPPDILESETHAFHTQRSPGQSFTFTITADSHLDEKTDTRLYAQTLKNAVADAPDFHIDLGDTFMTEKHPSRESAARQYVAQRYYFGLIGRSAPVFLVLGNHDGESARDYDGTLSSLGAWSNLMRTKYFPNPEPDAFYTGNTGGLPSGGKLEDYYAWTWGDALFVVLDPYWFSSRPRGRDDGWSRSLGETQYRWLEKTLSQSNAKFKFVFIHNLVGGLTNDARGGVEIAPYYEWGSHDPDGKDTFALHRPGWSMPIHQLLVKNHVSIVFHGHDHLFAKQDLGGIVYQEVPQPGFNGRWNPERATEAGYTHGTILGGSGHMRVDVSAAKTSAAYIGAVLPENEAPGCPNRRTIFEYVLSN
ncbi:metallophosphoesterase [bacterium]|nr:metallophosphoesterase [bacterium]